MANEIHEIHVVSNYNNSVIGAYTDIEVARQVALAHGWSIDTVKINHISPDCLNEIEENCGEETKKKIEGLTITDLEVVKSFKLFASI
jgi:hypothetical protein